MLGTCHALTNLLVCDAAITVVHTRQETRDISCLLALYSHTPAADLSGVAKRLISTLHAGRGSMTKPVSEMGLSTPVKSCPPPHRKTKPLLSHPGSEKARGRGKRGGGSGGGARVLQSRGLAGRGGAAGRTPSPGAAAQGEAAEEPGGQEAPEGARGEAAVLGQSDGGRQQHPGERQPKLRPLAEPAALFRTAGRFNRVKQSRPRVPCRPTAPTRTGSPCKYRQHVIFYSTCVRVVCDGAKFVN